MACCCPFTLDAGAGDSTVQPLFNVLIELVESPDTVSNVHPHLSHRIANPYLSLKPTTNTAYEELPHLCITIRLSGHDMSGSAFRRADGNPKQEF